MVGLQSSSQHEIMKKMHVFQILNGTDEKSVSNNTPPQATVFWRFEVENPLAEASVKKSSLKFNNVIWKCLAPLDHRMSQKQMCSTFSVM